MPPVAKQPNAERRSMASDVVLAMAFGMILLVLLFPLPAIVLDLLLVLNISAAILLLLMMFYLESPLDLSGFPALLLVLTLFRMSLNVASTKLILLDGQAGTVIDAFGRFVVGNNYVVGAVVFLILVVIQFVVITKGAGRIAEVAARFTLDAMPGKQMSIDADLNAGIIEETEARERRKKITDEAEFYGAMDGASKFVKGDAIAGLAITGVNIVGGLTVGIFQQGMPMLDALQTFTMLTIGDGLVSQIPALIVSIASGILVTKTASADFLGRHLQKQLMRRPEPLYLGGAMLLVVAILPGLPMLPFVVMGAGSLVAGRLVSARMKAELHAGKEAKAALTAPGQAAGELGAGAEDAATKARAGLLAPMQVEIGFSLVPLVDARQGGDLVNRIGLIRDQIRDEFGFQIPPVQIQDNLELGNNEYRILLRGLERARDAVYAGSNLAIDAGEASGELDGVRVTEPAFGYAAVWISPSRADEAEARGYTVVNAETVVATHLTKVIREHAAELLSRQEVSVMLEELKKTDEAVVNELSPEKLPLAVVHRVLQHLLHEQVPIHDLPAILETLADHAMQSKEPAVLGEFCRQALAGQLIASCVDSGGTLHAITLSPDLEEQLQRSVSPGPGIGSMTMAPARAAAICQAVQACYAQVAPGLDAGPVLLASPLIRYHLRQLLARKLPELRIMSYGEVLDDVPLTVHAAVETMDQREMAAA